MLSNRAITRILGQRSLASLLFGNGENGFLFGNFTELDELFTTSTGPTNVASDSDPVGLALDNHDWGSLTLAQKVAQASEIIANGGFDSDTVWVKGTDWAITGGKAVKTPGSSASVTQSTTIIAGVTYRISGTISGRTAGNITPRLTGGTAVAGTVASSNGEFVTYVTAVTGNNTLALLASATFDGSLDDISVKAVSGNHGFQATAGARPLWRANSGKPYLSFDGTDDQLGTLFTPTQSVALFYAAQFPASPSGAQIAMGSYVASNSRCWHGINSVGSHVVGWGTENVTLALGDLRNTTKVIVITGDASTRAIWADGVLLDERAVSGNPANAQGIMVGANNLAGTPSSFFSRNIFAAGALNRRVTPAEIARITSDFQRTYQ